jgi:predicted DNA-binding transcriptional regulator YafY
MIGVYDYKQRLGSFRVDRIAKRPKILEEAGITAPDGFDISEHVNTTFRMFDCVHEEVELICDNDVMDAIIDRFGEDVNVFPNDQNTFRAVVIVATSNVFYSWVFGFGGKVKIKSPSQVKDQYADMLRSAVTALD